jgi:SAM-dependent methyltransferase
MTLTDRDDTRRAFDSVAATYDALYEHLPGIRRLREATSRLFLSFFVRGSHLLEINCGTGNDALFLAQHGYTVLATDLSPCMLDVARQKVSRSGLESRVGTRLLSFEDVADLQGMLFDGIYSNLGGLNCATDLRPLAHDLGAILKPGGYFIAVVMPPFCLWETAAFLFRGQWKNAFRRSSAGGAIAVLHGLRFRTRYYSPRHFVSFFSNAFDHVTTIGLAVFLPPPNFDRLYGRLGPAVEWLGAMDERFARWPGVRAIGDHYAVVLRKRLQPAEMSDASNDYALPAAETRVEQ